MTVLRHPAKIDAGRIGRRQHVAALVLCHLMTADCFLLTLLRLSVKVTEIYLKKHQIICYCLCCQPL
ncbi:hypothetical protein ILYODFUR_014776 [Ilyodon furcidens]|uniref:Uncharacterized protein n=1 Tax=Ilyodon furcidens TaxID=33524 RepID=A0ABV0TJT7_9TELE